jgi:hypothetical protein
MERLSELADGRLLYRLKNRWRDGTTHLVLQPDELLQRLAVLIPVPRANLIRYHGVLAPRATLRAAIVTGYTEEADSGEQAVDTGDAEPQRSPRRYSWADLMRRVFAVDVLECTE